MRRPAACRPLSVRITHRADSPAGVPQRQGIAVQRRSAAAAGRCCSPTALAEVPDELRRLPRRDRLPRRRHQLPPARLLGPHRRWSCRASGTRPAPARQRLYSFRDIVVLKVVKRLLDAGVSLQNIRKAIETLRSRGVDDLAGITLISDGTTVYECRSPEEVVDLLAGRPGRVRHRDRRRVQGDPGLAGAVARRAGGAGRGRGGAGRTPTESDELGQRRRRRTASA